jgi:hypothetical protein
LEENMTKKSTTPSGLFVAFLLSSITLADEATNGWTTDIGYTGFSESANDIDISLGAICGSLGYRIKSSDRVFIMPEVKIGTGMSGDSVDIMGNTADVELDTLMALSRRGEYNFQNGAYVFVAPTYANGEFSANIGSDFAESSCWKFDGAFGAGYSFSDGKKVEVRY